MNHAIPFSPRFEVEVTYHHATRTFPERWSWVLWGDGGNIKWRQGVADSYEKAHAEARQFAVDEVWSRMNGENTGLKPIWIKSSFVIEETSTLVPKVRDDSYPV